MCFCHCVDPRTRCQVRWHPMGAGLGERRRVRDRERSEQTAWGEEATERDRVMDEFGEKKHREVGKEINSGLTLDYCHTHLLSFDAKEDAHCSFCGIFSDQCSRGVLFQVLPLILCALTPARVQPASVKRASRVWIMWQEAWCLKTEKLVTRSSSAHLDERGAETLICGCCNKSADLFPLTRCWVPFGLEDSISAQRFETSYTSSASIFLYQQKKL